MEYHASRPARSPRERRSPTAASSNGRAGPRPISSGAARARCSTSSPNRSCSRALICRKAVAGRDPARRIGKPKPIYLKDPKGFWTGTVLEPYGLVYHPKVLAAARRARAERLGRPAASEAERQRRAVRADALEQQPRDLRGHPAARRRRQGLGVAEAPRRATPASSPRAAATCRRWSRKGEFAAGFAVPSYMAFEDRLAGFDIKFVAPKTAWITPEPIADAGGRQASEGGAGVHRVHAVRARAAGGDGARRVPDHAEVPRAGRARIDARRWRSSSPAASAPTSTST